MKADGTPLKRGPDRNRVILNEEIQEIAAFVQTRKGGCTVTINEANHAITMTPAGPIFLGVVNPQDLDYEERGGITGDAPEEFDFG